MPTSFFSAAKHSGVWIDKKDEKSKTCKLDSYTTKQLSHIANTLINISDSLNSVMEFQIVMYSLTINFKFVCDGRVLFSYHLYPNLGRYEKTKNMSDGENLISFTL